MTAQACFTLDLDRCTGCSACRIACELANPVSPGVHWRSVTTFNPPRWSGATVLHWSLACNHCAAPPCLAGCPAAAYSKDAATGAVVLDRERCLGCRYCAWVCPYAAPQLDEGSGTMEKCTFCLDRQRRGELPACSLACPTGALGFASEAAAASPASPRLPGFPDTGTGPALRVRPRRRGLAVPEMTAVATTAPAPPPALEDAPLSRGVAADWPLLAFTAAAPPLVAWLCAGVLGGTPPPAPWFAGIGAAALAVSAFHLGRPLRAWRAGAGLRSSWVSREVAAFTAFLALGAAVLLAGRADSPAGWVAAAAGVAALAAMDMVYRVRAQAVAAVPHSAMATLSFALYAGVLAGSAPLAVTAALVKAWLYVTRRRRGLAPRPAARGFARLVLGLAAPLAAWLALGPASAPAAVAGVLLGELADRAELYSELAFLTPRRQASRDLAAAVAAGSGA